MTSLWQRVRQVLAHLTASMTDSEHELVTRFLSRDEQNLFYGMHIADQRHSVEVVRTLLAHGEALPRSIFKLALLHDIGKQRVNFALWERILVVLWPRESLAIPDEPLQKGLRRAWQIKRWHAEYGARMLEALAEPDPDLIELLRRNQASPPPTEELALFQWADDRN